MERKRSQQQRLKQQQRFCVSQQDLSEALAKMKPIRTHSAQDQRTLLANGASVSMERLTTPPVSQLIKEFEARATLTPYASAQELLPISNRDESSNEALGNSSHMSSIRTVEIKGKSNDNDIINNDVCLSISSPLIDDNQMVRVDLSHRTPLLTDGRKKASRQTSTPENDCHKDDLQSLTMAARCTDIDAAMQEHHPTRFDELLSKEVQLNNALADLISFTNDHHPNPRSISLSSSPRSPIHRHQRVSTPKTTHQSKTSISASIDLLNNLIETFDLDKTDVEEHDAINSSNANPEKNEIKPVNMFRALLSDNVCANCQQLFAANEQIVNAAGQIWHQQCFVCTQCFQPFDNGLYFEHEGRKYCERDFQMLFAPYCAECKQAIIGRVIRALQHCFHPHCFRCQLCRMPLVDLGFLKHNGRALCRDCHGKEKLKEPSEIKHICSSCHQIIDGKHLKYKGEYFHPYHFHCTSCRVELNENGREVQGYLYCPPCHNKLDLPICAACHRLIDERVIHALGKQWHVEHFCCARCARPFYGNRHYEHNGLAYCELDYHILFGSTCFTCNRVITHGAYTACNKKYCPEHFTCSLCEKKLNEKSKFYDVDATPVCKQCFGKLSSTVRKSSQKHHKHKRRSSSLSSGKFKQTSV